VLILKAFELTLPEEYVTYIEKEIKKPKRLNTELLELWLERELNIENPGTYGNLPTDESHVTVQILKNGNYKLIISDVCFDMIESHVQPDLTVIRCITKIFSIFGLISKQIRFTLNDT
jgi:hypothetical protein